MIGSPCTDVHVLSESGMVGAASMQYRAFPQELPPEKERIATPVYGLVRNDRFLSRSGRVIPLQVLDVSASESAPDGELRVVPRKDCLSSRFLG